MSSGYPGAVSAVRPAAQYKLVENAKKATSEIALTPITLTANSSAFSTAMVAVPNVVGMTQSAATASITGVGLTVGTVTVAFSSTVASGSVIGEPAAAGTSINVGSAVNIVVSNGRAQMAVPNAVGLTQAAATTSITDAGLAVGTVATASSSTVASGSIISESPCECTSVTVGSAVNLVVSSGVVPPVSLATTSTISGSAAKGYPAR